MTQDFPPVSGIEPMTKKKLPVDFSAFHQARRPAYLRWAETYFSHRADAEEAVYAAFEQLLTMWPAALSKESPAGFAWTVLRSRTIDIAQARAVGGTPYSMLWRSRRPRCGMRWIRSVSWRRVWGSSTRSAASSASDGCCCSSPRARPECRAGGSRVGHHTGRGPFERPSCQASAARDAGPARSPGGTLR